MTSTRAAQPARSQMTIHDIAREAGVSTATVSRALRGLPSVSPSTAARVQLIARRMDYVVSPTASRLASGRAGSVAVITPHIARWYFSTVLSGIERVLRPSDLDLVLLSVGDPSDRDSTPPMRKLRGRVDGVIVISLSADEEHVHDVLGMNMPMSGVGPSLPGVGVVSIDDVHGATVATQHLVNLGHERIGLIHGRDGFSPFDVERDRHRGFCEALAAAGIKEDPDLQVAGHFHVEGGEQAMNELLSRPNPPTGVFCLSDEMAFGALRSLRKHGLQPGRDVSVVGFDDHDMADLLDLTTIAQPVQTLGELAAQVLLDQLEDPGAPPPPRWLPTRLVVRGSTCQHHH
jgi:LacI family repressor for deo operon, udp, cdd, tsx, nupC, and nupG